MLPAKSLRKTSKESDAMDVKQVVEIFHHNQSATIPSNPTVPFGDVPSGAGLPLDLPQALHDSIPEVKHPAELQPGLHPIPARDGIPYQSEGSQGTGGEVNRNWDKSSGQQPATLQDDRENGRSADYENSSAGEFDKPSAKYADNVGGVPNQTSPDGK
jgi:hypothetical protein